MKLSGLVLGGLVLSKCAEPPEPEPGQVDGSLVFFLAATRLNVKQIENPEIFLSNPEQRNYIIRLFAAHDRAQAENLPALLQEAIANGTGVGCNRCGDSREALAKVIFPAQVADSQSLGAVITTRDIAAQPFIFQEGIFEKRLVFNSRRGHSCGWGRVSLRRFGIWTNGSERFRDKFT